MIDEHKDPAKPIPVKRAADMLEVSRSGYYKWTKRRENETNSEVEKRLLTEISRIVGEFPAYGYRRVTHELKRRGFTVNHKKVRRIMKENHLLVARKRFKPLTTDSNHNHRIYPNLVMDLAIERPNQVWASDITYIQLGRGFAYLAVLLDLYTRRCIGWALGRDLRTQLALDALYMALTSREGASLDGLIHHSDQGVQYASNEYVECLNAHGIQISMSRTGNPYDNAYVESFIKTLKTEEVYMNEYETFGMALENIERFIEEMYNKKRLHSALGYKTPMEFEQEVALNIA